MEYHIGITKRGKTLVIQARRGIDYLDCEIYDYMGVRVITKAHLHEHRYDILAMMQKERPNVYGSLRYAVVD